MSNIPELKLSKKGNELLKMYKLMVNDGYNNNLFNIKNYKKFLKNTFNENQINSVLDYGSGRSDWNDKSFDQDNNLSAINYFNLDKVYQYEPTNDINYKKIAECVLCFDVLEHIFISDLSKVVSDLYYHASKLLVLQVACYEAKAKLPNGENAHITLRNPIWWKGFVDAVSSNFKIKTILICSTAFNKASVFKSWSVDEWNNRLEYKIDL
jgi:hypothetical protein